MKRAFGFLIMTTIVVLMGCTSAPSSPKQNTDLPEWAENVPTSEEFIYFVGYAQTHDIWSSQQRAETRAMAKFSQWKSGVLKVETVESGETVTTTSSVNAVADVSGKVIELYIAADGGVYVLMAFSKTDAVAQE